MRKGFIFSVVVAAALLICVCALADDTLPADIRAALPESRWQGYKPVFAQSADLDEGYDNGRFYPVIMQKDNTNVLCVLARTGAGGAWAVQFFTDTALYPGDTLPQYMAYYAESDGFFIKYSGDINETYMYRYVHGQWRLSYAQMLPSNGNLPYTHIVCSDNKLVFEVYSDNSGATDSQRTRYGVYNRLLSNFVITRFPHSYAEASVTLSLPPEIPAGELQAKNVKFSSGKKYAVYSGPGTHYERAADGKAAVSTNDWIQVFGQENGWVLIQYDITAQKMRVGYIEATALPNGADITTLQFIGKPAEILENTVLTDDPLGERGALRMLDAGQEGITWLSTMGEYAYVQLDGGAPVRGFVPLAHIAGRAAQRSYMAQAKYASYSAEASAEVASLQSAHIEIAVTVPDIWLADELDSTLDHLIGYRLYLNGIPASYSAPAGGEGNRLFFTIDTQLDDSVTVLGLCPIFYVSGLHAQEAFIIAIQ